MGEVGPLADELCEPEFVVLLILEEFAYLEAGQLTADVVLVADRVEELEAGDGLLDDGPQLEVIDEVHKYITYADNKPCDMHHCSGTTLR